MCTVNFPEQDCAIATINLCSTSEHFLLYYNYKIIFSFWFYAKGFGKLSGSGVFEGDIRFRASGSLLINGKCTILLLFIFQSAISVSAYFYSITKNSNNIMPTVVCMRMDEGNSYLT